MKKLFFVLVLLLSFTFVSADLLQFNNFVYRNSPISNVGVLGFVCLTADCSSDQVQFVNLNSGSSSYLDIAYPNNGQSINYGLFIFKEGYIPFERTATGFETVAGDKRVSAVTNDLTRKDVCSSVLTDLVVTNFSNVVTIKTNVSSPISHSGDINFVPSLIASHYSVDVTLLLKINDSINQTRVVNLPFSGNSEQTFVVELSSGIYDLEIESFSNDTKCLSSNNQTKVSSITLISNLFTCTSFNYNSWSDCIGGIQTRTINESFPLGCVGGNPILSQTCSVTDTVAPVLNLPLTVYVNTSNFLGEIVYFDVNATDNVDLSPLVSCIPGYGSVFSIGATEVFCSASDFSGNSVNGSFNVIVNFVNGSNNQTNFSVQLISPKNQTYNASVIPLNYSIEGVATSCWYNLNGATIVLLNCTNSSISALNGLNNFTLFVSNGFNTISSSVSFLANLSSLNDTIPPIITVNSPQNKTYGLKNIYINVSLDEQGFCSYSLNNGQNKTLANLGNYFIAEENNLQNGNYLLKLFCSDTSSNLAFKQVYFKIDFSEENKDKFSKDKNLSESDFLVLAGTNEELGSLVLNESQRQVSPWAFFFVFLLLCILVLFFIVLVLLMRNKRSR